jgi:endo-1,4-beta-mannosidase
VAFKDEPTILAWETGNELHQGDAPFTNWTQDIARYIKEELGARQLVLDGRHDSFSSAALDNPDVDLLSDHYYSGWNAAIASAKTHSATVADAKKVKDKDSAEPLR